MLAQVPAAALALGAKRPGAASNDTARDIGEFGRLVVLRVGVDEVREALKGTYRSVFWKADVDRAKIRV